MSVNKYVMFSKLTGKKNKENKMKVAVQRKKEVLRKTRGKRRVVKRKMRVILASF